MSNAASREETIFNLARQLSRSQDRAAYLDDVCGSDGPLRDRVERLLQAEQHADKFLANDPLGLPFSGKVATPLATGSETTCSVDSSGAHFGSMATVAPVPGDVIEDYEIIEKIGGNMGFVFKARQRLLDKIVALKVLPRESIADPARLARFERELRALGQLAHPHLVTATDARVVDSWHLVSMEFIDGMDLQRLVETRGPLRIAAACEVTRQAALALQYAHEHGLIHRDIKPSNLMLTQSGTIKVIDMGLALIQGDTLRTQPGLLLGTVSYCAPEQFRDASRVDTRADIYSLGCTLYYLLTGKPPYSQHRTIPEVMEAHLREDFPSVAEARPDAPVGLTTLLARMTAKDPASRFETPGEVAEALRPFARAGDLKRLLPIRTSQPSGRAILTPGKAPEGRSRKPDKDTAPAEIEIGPVRPGEVTVPSGVRRSEPTAERRWKLVLASVAALLLAIAVGAFLGVTFAKPDPVVEKPDSAVGKAVAAKSDSAAGTPEPVVEERDPVVVLMDTTADGGVYDVDNRRGGGSNAKELYKVLQGVLPPTSLHIEPLFEDWDREDYVLSLRPDLVIIHRSSFFHSYNAKLKFGLAPEFANPEDDPRWVFLYNRIGDERLILLLGTIAKEVPQTRFLVYSRGTDKRWLGEEYRKGWVKQAESRFSELKDRIGTMVIPGGTNGTFRNFETAEEMRSHVKKILRLPDKGDLRPQRPRD